MREKNAGDLDKNAGVENHIISCASSVAQGRYSIPL